MNLNEEVLCGFFVSKLRKEVWNKELEMLKIFIKICEENKLKYMACGGTLIGAIRHKGFIPWDDDIDLMMPRADYEKFLEVAPKYLDDKYFLQYNKTEKLYPNGHAQIRDNKTTCFMADSYRDLKYGKNCGIFIDVFPYDYTLDDPKKRNEYAKKIKVLRGLTFNYIYKYKISGLKSIVKRCLTILYFCFHNIEKTINKINQMCSLYSGTNTVALTCTSPGYEGEVYPKEYFDEVVMHPFEDIMISIPKRYDETLRKEFGDYMKFPENKSAGNMHGGCFFDVNTQYEKFKGITKKEFLTLYNNRKL